MLPLQRILLLWSSLIVGACLAYEIPQPKVEVMQPQGLRVSIPGDEGIRSFYFRGKKIDNSGQRQAMYGFADMRQLSADGRWTYTNENIKLNDGDVLHYGGYVQHRDRTYYLNSQRYYVHGSGDGGDDNGLRDDDELDARMTPIGPQTTPPPTTQRLRYRPPKTTPPQPVTAAPKTCHPTDTSVNGIRNLCAGARIFKDDFANLSFQWQADVRIPNDARNAEFLSYQTDASVLRIDEAQRLHIQPRVLSADEQDAGVLDLRSTCTARTPAECRRQAFGFRIVPPAVSARLNTRASFSFRYGRVEVRARLPRGDWLFPLVLLEPLRADATTTTSSAADNGIRVASIRGNERLQGERGEEIGGRVLEGGVLVDASQCQRRFAAHVGDKFRLFSVEWRRVPNLLRLAVDGEVYCEIAEPGVVADEEYYIVLGVGVGGVSHFPDGVFNGPAFTPKPWHNEDPKAELDFWSDASNWSPTWTEERSALIVDYVRVYAI